MALTTRTGQCKHLTSFHLFATVGSQPRTVPSGREANVGETLPVLSSRGPRRPLRNLSPRVQRHARLCFFPSSVGISPLPDDSAWLPGWHWSHAFWLPREQRRLLLEPCIRRQEKLQVHAMYRRAWHPLWLHIFRRSRKRCFHNGSCDNSGAVQSLPRAAMPVLLGVPADIVRSVLPSSRLDPQ